MPSEPLWLDLDAEVIEELSRLARHADKLVPLVNASDEIGAQVGITSVAKQLSERIGLDRIELRELIRALLNFHHTSRSLKLGAPETAKVVGESLTRVATTPERKTVLDSWRAAKPRIVEAASLLDPDHALVASQKAYQVASARQHEIVRTSIYTDVRPVFNSAGNAITRMVVAHVLTIDYHDGMDHRQIQFHLDAGEVLDLKRLCQRAEQKAQVVKKELGKTWPTTIFRDPTEADDSK
jgi:hypothetical protein